MSGDDFGVFLVGVRKCGTSTIFDLLSRHSHISPSKRKETQFFALPPKVVHENISWYRQLFDERGGSILLDGSTFYFSSERAWDNIQNYFEDPRIIITIRDPVQRAYSAHAHMIKKAPSRDTRSFDEIVTAIRHRSDEDTPLQIVENKILNEAIRNGQIDADYLDGDYLRERFDVPFDSCFEDRLFQYRYFAESQYRRNIEELKSLFGTSKVKVIFFEELIEAPSQVIREIFDFLDLSVDSSELLTLPHKNRTKVPSGRVARSLMWLRRNSDVAGEAWEKLKSGAQPLAGFLRKITRQPKPELSKTTYESARKLLEDEYLYWEERIKCTGSLWAYK